MLAAPQTQVIEWASPLQQQAFEYGPLPQVASGGFGSGKTYAYCLKGLWLSDAFPRNRGLIFRSVAKDLRATTMATFRKICPASAYQSPDAGWNRMEGLTRLNNGSEILWLGLDNPELEDIIKGLEINWFFGDQAEDIDEEVFDKLISRLGRWDQATVPAWLLEEEQQAGRAWPWMHPVSGKPTPPQYPMLACNPDTELHWIYRRFHPESPEYQQTYRGRGYRLFHMPSLDNKFLTDQNRQNLLDQDESFVRRYVRGEWGLPEGSIHVVHPESVIEGSPELLDYLRNACTLHRFMDHGDTSPTCCLWMAVDRDANVFWYREYYLPNALISTHRENITALSDGERYELNQADPSIFFRLQRLGSGQKPTESNTEHGGRWSVADEYGDVIQHPRQTALFWSPADNNELGTRNRINEYLRVDPERVHPITKVKGAPRIFFVRASESYPQGVIHALRQTRAQRRVKVGTDMGRPVFSDERDPNIVDHAYDVVRYGVASRAPIAKAAQPQAASGTFFGEMQRIAKQSRSQQRIRR